MGQVITGVPQANASMNTMPNGSGQSIGTSSPMALPISSRLSVLVQLPKKLDRRMIEERLYDSGEVLPILWANLGGNL